MIAEAGCRRVLDLPCGSGMLTKMLLDQGIDVVAADLNPAAFILPGRRAVHADLNAPLPFENEEFDGVACVEGVEHIENPHHLVREANRLLPVGGKVFITTPNVLSIRSRLSYLLRGYPDQFHLMIEVDPETNLEKSITHINPIGVLELRYALRHGGFTFDRVQTNRLVQRNSLFYQLIRVLLLLRGRRTAASHPLIAEVRQLLLSDAILFGEGLIVEATKAAAAQ
jgi:SAM-dependent methyltransferase